MQLRLCFGEVEIGTVAQSGADFPNISGRFELASEIAHQPELQHLVDYICYSCRVNPCINADSLAEIDQTEEDQFIDLIESDRWFLVDDTGTRMQILIPIFHADSTIVWRWRLS